SITTTGGVFTVASLPSSIAAGGSATFSAVFTPTGPGSVTGSISIVSNAPNSPLAVALSGTGLQAAISATPSSVAFGNVASGNSNSQTVALKNTGTSALSISSVTTSGSSAFSNTSAPASIAAGATGNFNVVFAPTTTGSFTGTVTIASNAPNSPMMVPLTGAGVA